MLPILEKIHEEGEYRPTIKEVRQWFGVLNEIVFEGKVSKFRDISIKDLPGQFAAVQPLYVNRTGNRACLLEIGAKFKNFKFFITILAHEMIHCHQWMDKESDPNHDRKTFFLWKPALKFHGIELHIKYPRN